MKDISARDRLDPVARMVLDLTPKEFVDWLIEYKGLPKESAENVEMNLREQFKWQRLQGRLDRPSFAAIVAELLHMRSSVSKLEKPKDESKTA